MYHTHHMHLSEHDVHRLARGESVKIPHAHLKGTHKVLLTGGQVKKFIHAYHSGKGTTLKMSHAQVRKHVTEGCGFFSSLVSGAKKLANSDLGKFALNTGLNKLQQVGTSFINNKLGGSNPNSALGQIAHATLQSALNSADNKVNNTGFGVRKPRKPRKVNYSEFGVNDHSNIPGGVQGSGILDVLGSLF